MITIAMIEDDRELASLLSHFLKNRSMNVETFFTPHEFLEAVSTHSYDLAIVDLTLPGMDGLEICHHLGQMGTLPFIISSARTDLSDQLIGLERGADDYLPKPYDPRELVARIQTILRRRHPALPQTSSRLSIDDNRMEIICDGKILDLTTAEYEVLALLIDRAGSVLSRDTIADNVSAMKWESSERSIDVVISRIRKKLGDNPKNPTFIKAIKGAGYKYIG